MTFDSVPETSTPSNPNAKYDVFFYFEFQSLSFSTFVCPSSCYTEAYRSNQQEYPLYGNVSYSGVSLHMQIFSKIFFFQNFEEFINM
jgi:hypothetical protein